MITGSRADEAREEEQRKEGTRGEKDVLAG
jgi:hypothetical protein